MFRSYAQRAPQIAAGDKVILTGNMSLYAPRGNYQLMVHTVRKQGVGDLYQQFLQLKEKLRLEGLFEPSRKRPIPVFPQKIAVLTSPTGAAIRDILRTLQRRWGLGHVIVIPTVVQGANGKNSILQSLEYAAKTEAEVIILGRGGGSIEDLWNFNEEEVARAVVASPIPIVSGIGHESDFTIVDFVADVRASTPTAAAEQVVPDRMALIASLDEYERQMQHSLQYFIDFKRQVLDDYAGRLQQAVQQAIRHQRHELNLLEAKLQGLDSRKLLSRGYTLTLKDGKIMPSAEGIEAGDAIETIFADGRLESKVGKVEK